jgi:Flp pilus assembly protein TadG
VRFGFVVPARTRARTDPVKPALRRSSTADAGQAAVELVAGLPALLLLAVVVMQLLAVGYTAVLAGNAAEAGALAMARGGAPETAARAAIPGWARRGMQVRRAVGAVKVQMRPPRLVPWVGNALRIHASAAVAAPGRVGLIP